MDMESRVFLFGKTMECLDIYHAAQHISDCSKVLFGTGEAATEWLDGMGELAERMIEVEG